MMGFTLRCVAGAVFYLCCRGKHPNRHLRVHSYVIKFYYQEQQEEACHPLRLGGSAPTVFRPVFTHLYSRIPQYRS